MTGTRMKDLNPYVGPRAFTEEEREYFFGRDEEIQILTGLVMARRASLLFAPSGAGKSSLLRAGLIPELTRQERMGRGGQGRIYQKMRVLPVLTVGGAVPGGIQKPIANLYLFRALLTLLPDAEPEDLAHQTLTAALSECFSTSSSPTPETSNPGSPDPAPSTLLIFDQFEELFTQHPSRRRERSEFFHQVAEALEVYPNLHVLFSMREDYIAELTPYAALLPEQLRPRFRLELLGEGAAQLAIQEPACKAGVDFVDGAVVALLKDLRRVVVQRLDGTTEEEVGAYVEPVQLQVVCLRLWDRLPPQSTEIVEADLEAVGDVDQALAGYYADRVAAVEAETAVPERAVREWVHRHLITEQGIRGQVLQGPEESQGLDNRAIWPLVDAHLVRAEKRRGATWFELAHDRLVEPVRADNAGWLEAHLSPLQRQAALWEEQGRPAGLLLRDEALEDGEQWAAVNRAELTEVERAFLQQCQEAREITEREKRQSRRIRLLAIVAGVIALLALAIAGFAIYAGGRANQEARRALDAEATAAAEAKRAAEAATEAIAANAVANEQTALAEKNAADAEEQRDIANQEKNLAEDSAAEAERQARLATSRQLAAQAVNSAESQGLIEQGLLLAVEAFRATQAGGLPPVLEADDALRRALALAPLAVLRSKGEIGAMVFVFSADGRRLATRSEDGTARLLDAASGEELAVLRHEGAVRAVVFSADGTRLATRSDDGTARLLDAVSGEELAIVQHEGAVRAVVFSADGTRLATLGQEGMIHLMDAATGEEVAVLRHEDEVRAVVFSPDGRRLATRSEDGTARLVDPTNGEELAVLRHEGEVRAVVFSPDGTRLATRSEDGTVRLVDAGSGEEVAVLHYAGEVRAVVFSPDGTRLATRSADGMVRLVDAGTGEEVTVLRHEGAVWDVVFSPDGGRLATRSADGPAHLAGSAGGTARLVDATTGEELAVLRHEDDVGAVVFSSDGTRLATASQDGTVRLVDAATGEELAVLRHEGAVGAVVFSPEGTRLATRSVDGTIRLVDAATGEELAVLRHEREILSTIFSSLGTELPPVRAVVFSPDGTRLAIGSTDGTAYLVDAATGEELAVLRHEGVDWDVVFSPDGTRLATGTDDGTVRLVDAGTGEELAVLRQEGEVRAVAFSPDGARLATGSEDGTARLWNVATGSEPATVHHGGEVEKVAFNADGTRLATGSRDDTAHLVDVTSGRELAVLRHEGDIYLRVDASGAGLATVWSVIFSPDGSRLATGSADGSTHLVDATSGEELAVLHDEDGVWDLAFSPDGGRLATGSADGTAHLVDAGTGEELAVLHHGGGVWTVAFSPDGTRLVTRGLGSTTRLVDAATGEEVAVLQDEGDFSIIVTVFGETTLTVFGAVVFSPDGTRLAARSLDGTVHVVDTATGEELAVLRHEGVGWDVVFSPDGTQLATGSDDGTVRLVDIDTREEQAILRHDDEVKAVVFSSDGTRLASTSEDGTAHLWDATGEELAVLHHEDEVRVIVFSPDGRRLATGSDDGTVHLVDAATGEELAILRHVGGIWDVAFSLDGGRLATGSADGTVHLVDAASGRELAVLRHENDVRAVVFSPDGTRLATGSDDGTARLWRVDTADLARVACGIASRNLTFAEWGQYRGQQPYRATCPTMPLDPGELLLAVEASVLEGDTQQAEAALTQAVPLAIETYNVELSNSICRSGSLDGFAELVLPACEHAVGLAGDEDRPRFRDSRGLARALTGDYAGAIEDIQFYVDWAKENGIDEDSVARREAWITALDAGQNPFDTETLEALRNE